MAYSIFQWGRWILTGKFNNIYFDHFCLFSFVQGLRELQNLQGDVHDDSDRIVW